MKEELQGKLVEILGSIQSGVEKAGSFALEQLPDIAMQYLAFGRMYSTAVFLAILWVTVWLFKVGTNARKASKKNEYTAEEDFIVAFSFIGVFMGFFILLIELKNLIMVWAAPKVWLIKEIAGLIK